MRTGWLKAAILTLALIVQIMAPGYGFSTAGLPSSDTPICTDSADAHDGDSQRQHQQGHHCFHCIFQFDQAALTSFAPAVDFWRAPIPLRHASVVEQIDIRSRRRQSHPPRAPPALLS
jgi:hypothetical protein